MYNMMMIMTALFFVTVPASSAIDATNAGYRAKASSYSIVQPCFVFKGRKSDEPNPLDRALFFCTVGPLDRNSITQMMWEWYLRKHLE